MCADAMRMLVQIESLEPTIKWPMRNSRRLSRRSEAVRVAMASTNEESSSPSHHLALQHHQQELIKLLARHFHRQFYQLASTSNHLIPPATSQPDQLVSAQQQQQQQIQSSIGTFQNLQALHYSGAESESQNVSNNVFELNNNNNTMNLVTNRNQHHPHHSLMLQDRLLRSHHQNAQTATGLHSEQALLELANQHQAALSSQYSFNELNLFNALGLNLTNNQLVQSLQQQAFIQAAAGRQFESRLESDDAHLACPSQTDGIQCNQMNENISAEPDRNHQSDRKDLLKFSINTILGRGFANQQQSKSSSSADQQLDDPAHDEMKSFHPAGEKVNRFIQNKLATQKEDQHGSSGQIYCDHSESASDSGSINTSTTPTPQVNGPSMLFNRNPGLASQQTSHSNLHRLQPGHNHPNQHSLQSMQFLPGSAAFPWTVASRGKPRRGMMRRAVFSDSQRIGLEKRFQLQKYISKPDRKKLAEKLGLRDSQVKIWFQNRRMKWRNSKERELLSAGGSREQTLPTRNNPNPDLSDVGETIKRLTGSSNASLSSADK